VPKTRRLRTPDDHLTGADDMETPDDHLTGADDMEEPRGDHGDPPADVSKMHVTRLLSRPLRTELMAR
jgi:hypothetical protein